MFHSVKTLDNKNKLFIIIIIFDFENVAFFHANPGLNICPRADNQTSGNTLKHPTRSPVEKSSSAS